MAAGTRLAAGLLGLGGAVPFVAFLPQLSGGGGGGGRGDAAAPGPSRMIDEGKRALGLPADAAGGVRAQLQYGASIVSFLGAVHWGLAIAEGTHGALRLTYGVLPSIGAWLAMSAGGGRDEVRAADALAALLASCYVADAVFSMKRLLPQWYMGLRTPLTIVAVTSLYASRAEIVRRRDAAR